MKKRKFNYKRQEGLVGYIFILPWIIGFLVFTAGPLLFSLVASFTNYNITSQMDFIGTNNYEKLLFNDQLFWTSLYNTLYYVAFSVPLTTIGAIFLSVLLNQDVPGLRFFRTIYYLPAVLSGVGVLTGHHTFFMAALLSAVLGTAGLNGAALDLIYLHFY